MYTPDVKWWLWNGLCKKSSTSSAFLPTIYNFLWYHLKAVRANEDIDKTLTIFNWGGKHSYIITMVITLIWFLINLQAGSVPIVNSVVSSSISRMRTLISTNPLEMVLAKVYLFVQEGVVVCLRNVWS